MSLIGKSRKLTLACELAADRVVAARAAEGGAIDMSAVRTLNSGAITPSLTVANIGNPEAVRLAIQEAMSSVDNHSRDIIAVLPDGACRITLLDFDNLPEKREEAEAVVRFRLKKSLPFDVERARVSCHVQQGAKGAISVVAAVILNSVLKEYESVLREAGFAAGVVLPSILAALGQVDATVPTLLVKVEQFTTSIALVNENRLLQLRTLENPAGTPPEATQLAEDVYPSLVFYQDTYGARIQKVLANGVDHLEEFSEALQEQGGLRAQELVSSSRLGGGSSVQRSSLGGVVGALA
jgi:type IV pilus assembly protein PilM